MSPSILWISAFRWVCLSFSPLSFTSLFSAICKASSDNYFAFLHFYTCIYTIASFSCELRGYGISDNPVVVNTPSVQIFISKYYYTLEQRLWEMVFVGLGWRRKRWAWNIFGGRKYRSAQRMVEIKQKKDWASLKELTQDKLGIIWLSK